MTLIVTAGILVALAAIGAVYAVADWVGRR